MPTPTRTGYTFNGWYTATSDGTQVASSTMASITANQTLYAHWTVNSGTAYYNANGGKAIGTDACGNTWSVTNNLVYKNGTLLTKTVKYTDTTADLMNVGTALERTGYHIDADEAWLVGSTSGTPISHSASEVAASTLISILSLSSKTGTETTLYANWKPNTYTVKFYANGGTGTMADKENCKYGTEYYFPTCTFTKENSHLVGWRVGSTTGELISADAKFSDLTTTNGGTVKLYAQWGDIGPDTVKGDYLKITIQCCGNHSSYNVLAGEAQRAGATIAVLNSEGGNYLKMAGKTSDNKFDSANKEDVYKFRWFTDCDTSMTLSTSYVDCRNYTDGKIYILANVSEATYVGDVTSKGPWTCGNCKITLKWYDATFQNTLTETY